MKHFTLALLGLAATLALAPPAPAQPPVAASLEIDTASTGPVIERAINGQFAEHLGRGTCEGVWVGPDSNIPNTHGYRSDLLAALRKLRVPVIRRPDGCFADEYDWRDGIGPRARRPVRIGAHWAASVGRILTGPAMDTHNAFDRPDTIDPVPFAGRSDHGKLVFDLAAKSVAVVRID